MFEFHGWATIRVNDRDDPDLSQLHARQDEAVSRLQGVLRETDDGFSLFDVKRSSNGLIVLLAHGLRNHRYDRVIELFRWISTELPDSYGLLYIHDDEDDSRGADRTNEFRAWRLARGRFDELDDSFLSPYFPTVELPWE